MGRQGATPAALTADMRAAPTHAAPDHAAPGARKTRGSGECAPKREETKR